MNETMWQVSQVMMWALGIQTGIIIAVLGGFYKLMNSKIEELNKKIDKLSDKVEDIDRRLCRIEGSLATQGHCLLSQQQVKQDKQAL